MRIAIAATLLGTACRSASAPAIPPDSSIDAAPPIGVRHVPLTGCGYSFTGAFTIGGTTARLQIDTGSNALAVAAAGCTDCSRDGVSPLYSPTRTAQDLHLPAAATYDDGDITWTGELYEDDIATGGLAAMPVAFGAISSEQDFFGTTCGNPQGIVGLSPAPDGAASTGFFGSYLLALAAAGATDELAMSYCLGTGDLWLNGYDPTALAGDPSWVAMTQNDFYEVAVDDFAVAGASIGLPAATYGLGLVDSGGPNLIVPKAAFAAITSELEALPVVVTKLGATFLNSYTCVTLAETRAELDAELPSLTVQIGSPPLAIELPATAAYLQSYATTGGMTMYCTAIFGDDDTTDLGNTLLRAGVVIFDRAHSQLGFAAAPPCDDSSAVAVAHAPALRLRHR